MAIAVRILSLISITLNIVDVKLCTIVDVVETKIDSYHTINVNANVEITEVLMSVRTRGILDRVKNLSQDSIMTDKEEFVTLSIMVVAKEMVIDS
jgi:hypothetical protein